ncbi:hypothetical protein [Methylobacterium durans]|uniref:Uncharacterized protein n=1 Tax=Methylobacterium durans TaxID=2202825 RepID=A0A2U8W8V4_9HYPH|nr:hypothetical protein [Methylobacterium durans]AWN42563.1 hypothetical protein DK389_21215 [Methylobacterium durans]
MREADLDHAFAEALRDSAAFQAWLLSGGRFARHAMSARLLHGEQAAARKARHWWKHWWCSLPDGSQGETDIFAVFDSGDEGRFGIHVENKPPHGVLPLRQAVNYRRRAAFKANDPRWLNYSDFEVILVAPASFLAAHQECLRQFDRGVSYEEVAAFAPLFAEALLAGAA